jgi:glucosamine-6-phosphate deaminase
MTTNSNVEKYYLEKSKKKLSYPPVEKIGIVQVNNFPEMGKLTALRFLEWVQQNPDGVISLPTGKTPEHFIKWVGYLLKNWDKKEIKDELKK